MKQGDARVKHLALNLPWRAANMEGWPESKRRSLLPHGSSHLQTRMVAMEVVEEKEGIHGHQHFSIFFACVVPKHHAVGPRNLSRPLHLIHCLQRARPQQTPNGVAVDMKKWRAGTTVYAFSLLLTS